MSEINLGYYCRNQDFPSRDKCLWIPVDRTQRNQKEMLYRKTTKTLKGTPSDLINLLFYMHYRTNYMKWIAQWIFSTFFVSLQNILSVLFVRHKTDISEGPIDDFTSKLIFFLCFLCHNWSVLMPNHQLAPVKNNFCDSWIERLMFRTEINNCGKNPLCTSLVVLVVICTMRHTKKWPYQSTLGKIVSLFLT